jgi:hypothetical protein
MPETTRYRNRETLALQLPPALNLNKLGSVIIAQLLWHISFVKKPSILNIFKFSLILATLTQLLVREVASVSVNIS